MREGGIIFILCKYEWLLASHDHASVDSSNGLDGYNYSSDTHAKQSINFIVKCQAETILLWSHTT